MSDVESAFHKMIYQEEGFLYQVPCLDITLYWHGPVFDRSEGLVAFYRACMEYLKNGLAYYRTETMTKARPLKKGTLDLLPFWLAQPESRRDIYMLTLESGRASDEVSDRAFAFYDNANSGTVRLVLPISFITQSVEPYIELARRLGSLFAYDFGMAGYAINWNNLGRNTRKVLATMNSLAGRYPGLDLSDPETTKYIASTGIKCVNWLTFLGPHYCERLGGVGGLRQQLSDDVVFHDSYNGGLMIQAGPAPEIGDVNRQRNLPIYHEVGRVLSGIRSKKHPSLFGPDGLGDRDATEKWLSRFDS